MRPLVGVTLGADSSSRPPPRYRLNQAYVEALAGAGAQPILLPPVLEGARLLGSLDGLVLSGGADVDPALYGEARRPLTVPERPRDDFEIPLVRAALDGGLPVLAICRGHQVVNVALGGTLHQHLEAEEHRGDSLEGRQEIRHARVRLDPDSHLAELLGVTEIAANSLHHQAVRDLAPGLRATGWTEDGIVEAMETPDGSLISVQSHPEELVATQPWAKRLFEAFVERLS